MQKEKNYWIGKKVKIEILKNEKILFFTAEIVGYDDLSISFIDRDGISYSFNKELVKQITEIGGQHHA